MPEAEDHMWESFGELVHHIRTPPSARRAESRGHLRREVTDLHRNAVRRNVDHAESLLLDVVFEGHCVEVAAPRLPERESAHQPVLRSSRSRRMAAGE